MRHISAAVNSQEVRGMWRLTGFYRHLDTLKRHKAQALLKHQKASLSESWLCVEDFNKIVDQKEKYGSAMRRESQMEAFREATKVYMLCDLGFKGYWFTWTNQQDGSNFTNERLY